MANFYNNGGFSNKKISYGSGGAIYNPSGLTQTAPTISLRYMRLGGMFGPPVSPGYPGDDEIYYNPSFGAGSAYYTFPAIDSSWDPLTDLGFVVTISDTSVSNIANAMTPYYSSTGGTTTLLDYAPVPAQAAVSWSVHMFYGQPKAFGGFYNFHQSSAPGTGGAFLVSRTSFAIRGGCVDGQIRSDFNSFYNKNMNFQPSPTSIPQTWPVTVGTRGVVLSMGWLDDDYITGGFTAATGMDGMLINTYVGPGAAGSTASLGVGYTIFNSPAGGTFSGNNQFGGISPASDQASSGSIFIPVPLLGPVTYTGTTQPKRSGIWDVGASYRAKFQGPREKRTKVAREYVLSIPIKYVISSTASSKNLFFSPDGKSLYGSSNTDVSSSTSERNKVIKIPLANAWDLSSINMAGFTTANILSSPASGGKILNIDARYGLTISGDGKSVSMYGALLPTSLTVVSVPLDTLYDILSTNTKVILRSMAYSARPPGQILENGRVVQFKYDVDTTGSPEAGSNWYNYRGFSDYPYSANNFSSTSYVPASRDWNSTPSYYALTPYGSQVTTPPQADIDNQFFSNDGRYSVSITAANTGLTVLKLRTPFDPTTHEVYDIIEFANATGLFPATTAMKNNYSQYKVFHYDQENDKIFLYRTRFTSSVEDEIVSIVEIS